MKRYTEFTETIIASQGKRRHATLYYPRIPQRASDIFIITKKLDRLDLIAKQYYGDPRYWTILATCNDLHAGTLVVDPGLRIRIPYPLVPSDIETLFEEAQF
jgi:hypothetical protein